MYINFKVIYGTDINILFKIIVNKKQKKKKRKFNFLAKVYLKQSL